MNGRLVLAWLSKHRLSLAVFAVTFVVRMVYLIDYSRSPFFQVHIADALYHEQWAGRILAGDVFSLSPHDVLYKAPLYPYFLALCFLLSGKSNFFAMFVQVVLTAGSCTLLFHLGKRAFGTRAGFLGAMIFGFYFPSVYFSTEMEIPALAIFLTLLSFYLLVEGRGILSLLGSAVTLGLSVLALPSQWLLLPWYAFRATQRQETASGRISRGALVVGLALGTVAPCTLRNWIAGGHATLVSANGGINLYLGNNPDYDRTVYLQPGYAFEALYDEPRRAAGADSFVARDRYWTRKAFAFMLRHPAEEAALLGKKLVLYLASYEIYRNTDLYYAKAHSLYADVPFLPASLVLAGGLGGLLLAARRRQGLDLAVLGGLLALPCLIFFVTDRYRLPSMAVWASFAGAFVSFVVDTIAAKSWRPALVPVAVASGIAILSSRNGFVIRNPEYRPHFDLGFIYETQGKLVESRDEYAQALRLLRSDSATGRKLESELHARIGNVHMLANQPDAARQSFERAIELDPTSVPAYSYLGTLYAKQKQAELAIRMFEKALALNPWDVVSLHNFARFYLENDALDQALPKLERALELAPEHAGARSDLAYLYAKQGKLDRAESESKLALAYDPERAAARYNLAFLYLSAGRIDEAMAEYRTITRIIPRESSKAYNQLGVIYAQRGDLRQALDNWQRAIEVDPSNEDARANLERARLMLR